MKKTLFAALFAGASLVAALPAHASDRQVMLPIQAALASQDAETKLGNDVKFYFGNQKHPKVLTRLGSDSTNKKTNAFGKSDEKACNWAFLSAMMTLEKRAHELGANAVINIVSFYKKNPNSSDTQFECHAGGLIAGVALKGDFVKIAGRK